MRKTRKFIESRTFGPYTPLKTIIWVTRIVIGKQVGGQYSCVCISNNKWIYFRVQIGKTRKSVKLLAPEDWTKIIFWFKGSYQWKRAWLGLGG